MSLMHPEDWLDMFQIEHEERLRAARMGRLAVSLRPGSSPVRRRFGSALIRLGLLVGGPTLPRPVSLVPAQRGGATR